MRDTTALFSDYLSCPYKAFLKLKGEVGEVSAYEKFQLSLNAEQHKRATAFLSANHPTSDIVKSPTSVQAALRSHGQLFVDATENDATKSWTFDAIELDLWQGG